MSQYQYKEQLDKLPSKHEGGLRLINERLISEARYDIDARADAILLPNGDVGLRRVETHFIAEEFLQPRIASLFGSFQVRGDLPGTNCSTVNCIDVCSIERLQVGHKAIGEAPDYSKESRAINNKYGKDLRLSKQIRFRSGAKIEIEDPWEKTIKEYFEGAKVSSYLDGTQREVLFDQLINSPFGQKCQRLKNQYFGETVTPE